MRLKSNSVVSWTRARPGPTIDVTIDSICSRSRRSKATCRSSTLPPSAASPAAPSASRRPASSTIDTRSGLSPLTAEATRWRIARTCWVSSMPRTLSTIEADGSTRSRENSGRSGSTRCTRAISTRDSARMVRASSPSSARKWLMFWMKLVAPRVSDLSKIS